jgi:tetratricopeptide (TPR) repeat protein
MQHIDAEGDNLSDPERARELTAKQEQATIVEALQSESLPSAIDLCQRLYGQMVGRYFFALLGTLEQAQSLSREVIETVCGQWTTSKSELPTLRAQLLMQAKKRCAVQLSLPNPVATSTKGATKPALEARRLLSELRPSERELLVLRFVAGLSHVEIAYIFGCDEVETRRRLSSAIVEACYATDPRIVPSFVSAERKAFLEQLVSLIDGTAPSELRLRVAEDDALRDELHVATQVTRRIAGAAEDYPNEIGKNVSATVVMSVADVVAAEKTNSSATSPEPVVKGMTVVMTAPGTPVKAAGENVAIVAPIIDVTAPRVDDSSLKSAEPAGDGQATPRVDDSSLKSAEPAGDGQATPHTDDSTVKPLEPANKGAIGQGNVAAVISPLPKKSAWLVTGIATVAVAAIIATVVGIGQRKHAFDVSRDQVTATLVKIERTVKAGRVELCAGAHPACRDAAEGALLLPGEVLRTNRGVTARLTLKELGDVLVEQDTEISFDDEQRTLRLERGRLNLDVAAKQTARLDLVTKTGRVEVSRGKFVLAAEPERTLLEVSRGSVALSNQDGQRVTVREGEQGVVEGKAAPSVFARSGQSVGLAVDEGDDESNDPEAGSRGLGELIAKKPGETKERADAVRLSRHRVSVRIVGAVARTEIEETFTNDTKDVLEGVFRFPLPSDAQIERLALDVDGRLVEGAFVDRERAAAIWRGNIVNVAPQMKQQIHDDFVWVPGPWRDPALLEWQRGNRFELRIYPIPKQGQRRIILAYTQVLPEAFGRRQYNYPLPIAGSSTGSVEDFSVDLELRNHDLNVKPLVRGYEVEQSRDGADVTRLKLLAQRFVPKGDFSVEFALPNRNQSLQAWAYRSDDDRERPYAAMLLRPKLPSSQASEPRDFAFVLDVSRSMVGEELRRAVQIVSRMLRELSPEDRVTLLACDSDCRTWSEGLVPTNASVLTHAERWLNQWSAEGASDPGFAIESAMRAIGGSSNRRVELVYVGDGTATVGAVRPAAIQNYVRRIVDGRNVQVTAVAIGTDADLPSLRALARGGRGSVVPYVPGTRVSQASRAAMVSILGNHLTDVTLELPYGMTLESRPDQVIAAGGEILIPARLNGSRARGDVVLRGRIAEQPFEQRYSLELEALSGERHAFVPRLYAASRIAELDALGDESAKREAIELSRRFSVASRHTSLLVLESSAMFKAFGLDNQRQAQTWTGEFESEATVADAEGEVATAAVDEAAPSNQGAAAKTAAKATAPAGAPAPAPMSIARGTGGSVSRKASSSAGPLAQEQEQAAARGRTADEFANRPLRMERDERWLPQRRMVPMRRIWERQGEVQPGVRVASIAKPERILAAESELTRFPDRRNGTKVLFDLYVAGDELLKAEQLAQRWNERDPLDVEAIVARADMAASRGERELAIRILGSIVDVRPGDVGAQQRLARLYRWQGQEKTACRFAVALAAFRSKDKDALTEALRCTQALGQSEPPFDELRRDVLQGMAPDVAQAVERLAVKQRSLDTLSGDLQLFAKWHAERDVDLDLALIDPDGHRISWLGAPSRSVISALQVVSPHEESLALRGGKPGQYVVEITRVKNGVSEQVPVTGSVEIVVAGQRRTLAFELTRVSDRLGLVTIKQVAKLVPLPI